MVLSGDRPVGTLAAERSRLAFIDGRLPDLDANPPRGLVPLVSDNYVRLFKWRGDGEMPDEEQARLREYVRRAHAQGRRIRFWASPDTAAAWDELYRAGVDLINTDDLRGLRRFLSGGRR